MWHSDVRKCLNGAHNCSQLCVELAAGRYECRCMDGYELADDQVTCKGTVGLALFLCIIEKLATQVSCYN